MGSKNSWYYIAILSFFVAVVWGGVSAYSQIRKSTVSEDTQQTIEPLNPKLDLATMEKIKQRAK